jgi:hypothetical protein
MPPAWARFKRAVPQMGPDLEAILYLSPSGSTTVVARGVGRGAFKTLAHF